METLHDKIVAAIEGITEPLEVARATSAVVQKFMMEREGEMVITMRGLLEKQDRLIEILENDNKRLRNQIDGLLGK